MRSNVTRGIEAKAFALDLDNLAVVQKAIQHGRCEDPVTGKSLIQGAEAESRGHDGGASVIAHGDDLE